VVIEVVIEVYSRKPLMFWSSSIMELQGTWWPSPHQEISTTSDLIKETILRCHTKAKSQRYWRDGKRPVMLTFRLLTSTKLHSHMTNKYRFIMNLHTNIIKTNLSTITSLAKSQRYWGNAIPNTDDIPLTYVDLAQQPHDRRDFFFFNYTPKIPTAAFNISWMTDW